MRSCRGFSAGETRQRRRAEKRDPIRDERFGALRIQVLIRRV
jgi:hypothetical protein